MGSIIAPRERGRYAGYMGAVMAVSTVSGPLLGGVIVDSPLGWRWCFFVCIPLAVISSWPAVGRALMRAGIGALPEENAPPAPLRQLALPAIEAAALRTICV